MYSTPDDNSVPIGAKMAFSGGGNKRIFLAQFRPDSDVQFVSVGICHVKFWTIAGNQLVGRDPIFPKSIPAKMQTMLSMAFAPVSFVFNICLRLKLCTNALSMSFRVGYC